MPGFIHIPARGDAWATLPRRIRATSLRLVALLCGSPQPAGLTDLAFVVAGLVVHPAGADTPPGRASRIQRADAGMSSRLVTLLL